MSDVRDPETDQKLPEPGKIAIHEYVIQHLMDWGVRDYIRQEVERGLRQRLQLGISKYGRPLESHNGRDALQDAWEESLDAMVYTTQLALEGYQGGAAVSLIARKLVKELAAMRLGRCAGPR